MYFVDRSVAVIKPKAPFLAWLNGVPDNDMIELTLDALRADSTVILLPEFDEPEEAVAHVDEIFDQLFRLELASWYEDESLWPQDRSLKRSRIRRLPGRSRPRAGCSSGSSSASS